MEQGIVIKSEDCMQRLKEWRKSTYNGTVLVSTIMTVIFGAVFFFMVFYENIDHDFFTIIFMIGTGIGMAFSIYKANNKSRKINEDYQNIESLCHTELLVVYANKIYGTTVKGQFWLEISEIDDVMFRQRYRVASEDFLCDDFVICDTVGNKYCFSSFSNVRELAVSIENIRRSEV